MHCKSQDACSQSQSISLLHTYIGVLDTVADCLQNSTLSQFQAQIANEPELNAALQSDDGQYTIFAPSNEAFNRLSDVQLLRLFSGLVRRQTLEVHIANKTIPSSRLREGAVIQPLEACTLLHITKFERWLRASRRYSVVSALSV